MTQPGSKTVLIRPVIPTGGRPILPNGGPPKALLLVLCVVPAIAIAIAAVDTRPGFQLFMASLAAMMIVLIAALYLRLLGLQAGAVRIAGDGGLRFSPPPSHRVGLVGVPLAALLPVAALGAISALNLETQASSSRLMFALPYVLTAVAVVSLARVAWSLRYPVGLKVSHEGLTGVRGGAPVDLAWDDILSASPSGEHGPRLRVLLRSGESVMIDGHHLGSDPAIVAAVIEFYRATRARRGELADGRAAIRAVEASAR